MQYIVEIVERETGKVEYSSSPTTERRAQKIEDGMSINLNHEHFFTRITEVQEWPEHDVDPEEHRHARDEQDIGLGEIDGGGE